MTRWSFTNTMICIGLFLLTLGAYWRVSGCEFVRYDDNDYVYEFPLVTNGLEFRSLWAAFPVVHASNWHPLTWISHMVDWELFGSNPAGHHWMNLLFHATNAVLLFVVFWRMTGAIWPSAFVALLFAVHPVNVESVAWVSQRKTVLSTFFWLLSTWAYVGYCSRPGVVRYLATLLLFALALLCKPMVVTFPFALLLLDYWPLRRSAPRETGADEAQESLLSRWLPLVIEKTPFFVIAGLSCLMTLYAQESAKSDYTFLPMSARLANAIISYLGYMTTLVWPFGLHILYLHPMTDYSVGRLVIGGAILLAVTIAVLAETWERPYLTMGWLWFLGTMVPMLGLVQVGLQSMADRYAYIPFLGLFIMIAWGVEELTREWPSRVVSLASATAVVAAICTVLTYQQVQVWRDSRSLFEQSLAQSPESGMMHYNLGVVLGDLGEFQKAGEHLAESIRINPRYDRAQIALANLFVKSGQYEAAAARYDAILKLNPNNFDAYYGRGATMQLQGKAREAVFNWEAALVLRKDDPVLYRNLALAMLQLSELDKAAVYFVEALKLDPTDFASRNGLGKVLGMQGRLDDALVQFQEALKYQPGSAEALNNIGVILMRQRKLAEAEATFAAALQVEPRKIEAIVNLGVVLHQQGKFADEIRHYQSVLAADPKNSDVLFQLARAQESMHEELKAVQTYLEVLKLRPDLPDALQALAWIHATSPEELARDNFQAMVFAEQANQLTKGTNPIMLDTLAAAYAEAGRFADAIKFANQAIALAKKENQLELASRIERRLSLYQQGKPFHREPAPSASP